ncbi:hypothetical protein TNCT_81801, partial [Trichonephila clavata]
VIGTPTDDTWDGVSQLPNYKPQKFGHYSPQPLSAAFPRITEITQGETLAQSFLQLQPRLRISANDALHHIYFDELPPKIYDLPEQVSIYTVSGCKLSPEPNNHTVIKIKQ